MGALAHAADCAVQPAALSGRAGGSRRGGWPHLQCGRPRAAQLSAAVAEVRRPYRQALPHHSHPVSEPAPLRLVAAVCHLCAATGSQGAGGGASSTISRPTMVRCVPCCHRPCSASTRRWRRVWRWSRSWVRSSRGRRRRSACAGAIPNMASTTAPPAAMPSVSPPPRWCGRCCSSWGESSVTST